MKIKQYSSFKKKSEKGSFQKEVWESIWTKNSFDESVRQLSLNPIYWNLKQRLKKRDKILEAGCGFGQWVYRLKKQGYNIIGVDIADKTLRKITRRFPFLDLKIGDVKKLPFKNNSFDVYLSFGVIEHFEEGPDQVLDEAHRVLKRDGLLYLTIPYLNLWRFLKYRKSPKIGEFYQYLYTANEIKKKIEKAGFKIEKVNKYDFLSAFKKDFPLFYKLSQKLISKSKIHSPRIKIEKEREIVETEPNFTIQRILYKLDSYVILYEARKI